MLHPLPPISLVPVLANVCRCLPQRAFLMLAHGGVFGGQDISFTPSMNFVQYERASTKPVNPLTHQVGSRREVVMAARTEAVGEEVATRAPK